ncbi:MAG TPA: iron-sulfur cluster assembly accessory protein [Terriglobales bacterium]|nr:iron-sulfur cluster assembly accessory protein [Terriglobales bacterium]
MATMTDKPADQATSAAVSLDGGQQPSPPGQKLAAPPAKGIQVTERALAKIKVAMAKEGISPEQGGLRLGVQGGGCSGLTYNIRFDTQPRERDRIFQFGDVRVFVDPKSFIYLHGMTLDYQETLMQQSFVFVNPNASKSCGCGTSFS